MTELYGVFDQGIRFFLFRQLGSQDLDDKVHDIFLIVVRAIQRGDLRDPERLMGFVQTIVRRQVTAYIKEAVHRRKQQAETAATGVPLVDHGSTAEQRLIDQQHRDLIRVILAEMLSSRDRQILTRCYLDEQTEKQICEEMFLTGTQYRLLKSRAKARFGELGKQQLLRPLNGFSMGATACS